VKILVPKRSFAASCAGHSELLPQIRENCLLPVLESDQAIGYPHDLQVGDAVAGVDVNSRSLAYRDPVNDRNRRPPERDGADLQHVRGNRHNDTRIRRSQADNHFGDTGLPMQFLNQVARAANDSCRDNCDSGHHAEMTDTDESALVSMSKSAKTQEKHTSHSAYAVPPGETPKKEMLKCWDFSDL